MAFPTDVLTEIQRGEQYLSNLNTEYLADLQRGCTDCLPSDFDCLRYTMRALKYKVILDEYDSIAISNLEMMQKIIGDYQVVTPAKAYWGVKANGTVLTYNQIIAGNVVNFAAGQSYFDIPYNFGTLQFPWFAYPQSETFKGAYQDLVDPDNQGTIGNVTDLFGPATNVAGAVPLRFEIAQYPTIQLTGLRIKNS